MKFFRPLLILAVLCLVLTASPLYAIETSDPSCTIPPANADANTNDQTYLLMWKESPQAFDDLFYGLKAESDDWDDGWGWSDRFNLDRMMPRLVDAAQVVWLTQQYTRNPGFGLERWTRKLPDDFPAAGHWWDFVSLYGEDEWEPGCDIPEAAAVHIESGDVWNSLQLAGGYNTSAFLRGASIVHEIVHQDVSHRVFDSDCNPPTPSCDDAYAEYNANTLEIDFYHDAMTAFQTTQLDGKIVRQVVVSRNDETCSWIPLFSSAENKEAEAETASTAQRFHRSAWPGWQAALADEVAKRQAAGEWNCQFCDLTDHQWLNSSSICDQVACNETVNSDNATVNAVNLQACQDYNTALEASTTEEAVATARDLQVQETRSCLPASEEDARNYCDSEKTRADSVEKLDQCGWLDPVEFASISRIDCIQEFCHEKYQGAGDIPDDPHGCLDFVCGDSAECGGDGESDPALCADWFREVEGDPEYYVAGCEWNKCKSAKVQCLQKASAAGDWTYGQPVPADCAFAEEQCNLISRLAAEAFINLKPFLDPGPMRERFEGIANVNPGKNVYRFAEQVRAAAASDSILATRMAVDLTSTPEMIAALFHVAPEEFVGMYGKEGFATLLGPVLNSVSGKPLAPADLTPAGQAAFGALQEQLELAGGSFRGAIGTLSRVQ